MKRVRRTRFALRPLLSTFCMTMKGGHALKRCAGSPFPLILNVSFWNQRPAAQGRQRSFGFWTADIQLLNLSYRQQRLVNVSKEVRSPPIAATDCDNTQPVYGAPAHPHCSGSIAGSHYPSRTTCYGGHRRAPGFVPRRNKPCACRA